MSWPTTKAGTTNIDAGSDKPALARPDIKQNIDNVLFVVASGNNGIKHPVRHCPGLLNHDNILVVAGANESGLWPSSNYGIGFAPATTKILS